MLSLDTKGSLVQKILAVQTLIEILMLSLLPLTQQSNIFTRLTTIYHQTKFFGCRRAISLGDTVESHILLSEPCDFDRDHGNQFFCTTLWLHTKFGNKRLRGSQDIVQTKLGHTDTVVPISLLPLLQ